MKKALIFWGGWDGHEPKQVSEIFRDILQSEGFEVTLSDTLDCLADAEKLKEYDLIIPEWTMSEIKPEYVTNLCAAIENGSGLAGCHGGMCDAFRNSTEYQFLTGAQWVAHPGNDGTPYRVNFVKNSSSPIIKGMDDFDLASEHYYIHIDPAVNVLATTRFPVVDGPHAANGAFDMPVAFTKLWGKGRVFYSSLGHVANVFDIYEAKQLQRNGFLWAARCEEKI